MTRLHALSDEETPESIEPIMEMVASAMGYVPNNMKIMAHWPELLQSFAPLGGLVLNGGELDRGLKQMIGALASAGAGCSYCQAHTSHGASEAGVPAEKLAELWAYGTSAHFDDRERAALDLAFAAGQVPNAATDAHFAALKEHYRDREIVEIVAVIALFGFLNRWSDTFMSTLEAEPLSFATDTYSPDQWQPGDHAPTK